MDNQKMDTQSKIIATAIDMIGKQANLNFTIREIAEKANVNLASVNYYFRSKENLLVEIERIFTCETQLIYDDLYSLDVSPRERIRNWACKIMEQILEYPGIIFLLVTKLLQNREQNAGVTSLIENSESSLMPVLKEMTGITDDIAISAKALQLLSGVIAPVLFYHATGKSFKVNICSPSERLAYIESLIDSIGARP